MSHAHMCVQCRVVPVCGEHLWYVFNGRCVCVAWDAYMYACAEYMCRDFGLYNVSSEQTQECAYVESMHEV